MTRSTELTDTLIGLIPDDGSRISNAEIQAALELESGDRISDLKLKELKSRVIAMKAAEAVRGPGGGLKAPGVDPLSSTGLCNLNQPPERPRSPRKSMSRSVGSFAKTFKAIDRCLREEAGCGTELDYTEQTSWLLFLKYLDGVEEDREALALIEGRDYSPILAEDFRWDSWAAPKNSLGHLDHNSLDTGDDLRDFVDKRLFPYLEGFKESASSSNTIEYKIGEIFSEIRNKISSGYNLREIINLIDELRFRSQAEKHELSMLYEEKIKRMGNAGRNGGEYYTPRPLIRAIIEVVNPKIGETIYDPAVGSAGFLCEAFRFMRAGGANSVDLGTQDLDVLQNHTFVGKEKKSLAYVIAIMNMILHGIEAPNVIHTNTLAENLNDIQEKDRYDIVLANPPFGGSERAEVQQNFSIKSSETALLFLQHHIRMLRAGGRAGVVIKNTFLSNVDNASIALRKKLLEECNVHTILDCPTGTFQGAGAKTVVLFFEKGRPTQKIWFYQLNPGRKFGKTKPLNSEDLIDFLALQDSYSDSRNSWSIDIDSVDKTLLDLSVNNPNNADSSRQRLPSEILDDISSIDRKVEESLSKINLLLS